MLHETPPKPKLFTRFFYRIIAITFFSTLTIMYGAYLTFSQGFSSRVFLCSLLFVGAIYLIELTDQFWRQDERYKVIDNETGNKTFYLFILLTAGFNSYLAAHENRIGEVLIKAEDAALFFSIIAMGIHIFRTVYLYLLLKFNEK